MKPKVTSSDVPSDAVDIAKLEAAIRARRDLSRVLNQDWEIVDRETWPAECDAGD